MDVYVSRLNIHVNKMLCLITGYFAAVLNGHSIKVHNGVLDEPAESGCIYGVHHHWAAYLHSGLSAIPRRHHGSSS